MPPRFRHMRNKKAYSRNTPISKGCIPEKAGRAEIICPARCRPAPAIQPSVRAFARVSLFTDRVALGWMGYTSAWALMLRRLAYSPTSSQEIITGW